MPLPFKQLKINEQLVYIMLKNLKDQGEYVTNQCYQNEYKIYKKTSTLLRCDYLPEMTSGAA